MERDILNRKITKKNGEKVPIRTLKLQEQLKYGIGGMIRKRNTQNKKKE